jgi:hypothetical protein
MIERASYSMRTAHFNIFILNINPLERRMEPKMSRTRKVAHYHKVKSKDIRNLVNGLMVDAPRFSIATLHQNSHSLRSLSQ